MVEVIWKLLNTSTSLITVIHNNEISDHQTPFMLAAANHHLEVLKFLIESAKCDPNPIVDTGNGRTLLHYACLNGQLSLVQYLVEVQNCNPMLVDSNLYTPLHYAAFIRTFGNTEIFNS